jgi:hypothetical protein
MDEATVFETKENIRKVLQQAGLDPIPIKSDKEADKFEGFEVLFKGDPAINGIVYLLIDESRFVFHLNFREQMPINAFTQLVEFLNRLNWDMSIGNFEINYDKRFVRFKSSLDFLDEELTPHLIRNVILSAIQTVDDVCDDIFDVAEGRKTAIEAIKNYAPLEK